MFVRCYFALCASFGSARNLHLEVFDDAEVLQEVAQVPLNLRLVKSFVERFSVTQKQCDLLSVDDTLFQLASEKAAQPTLIQTSGKGPGDWSQLEPIISKLLDTHGEEVVRVNNGRFGAGKVHRQLQLQRYLQQSSSDFHVFTVNRPRQSAGANASVIDEVRRLAGAFPLAAVAAIAARWIFSLGVQASHVDRHSHEESWLLLLQGRKAWWVGAEPGSSPDFAAWEDPCGALGREAPAGVQLCVQNPGEVVYLPTHLEHSTCNLDPLVLGVGAQGRRSDWPLIAQAAQDGDLSAVRELLEQSADLQASTQRGQSALHVAAAFGHVPVIGELLVKGAPSQADHAGQTALHHAAEAGHTAAARLLLNSKALLHARDTAGRQPLHLASMAGHHAMVKELLRRRADVSATSRRQEQALHLSTNNCRLTSLLLAFGADVAAADEEGVQAIHWAAAGGSQCAINALLSAKASLHSGDHVNGGQAIHWAAANGRMDMLSHLLTLGASAWAEDSSGLLPMHWAAGNGQSHAAQQLRWVASVVEN